MMALVTAFGFADATGVGNASATVAGPPGASFDLKWREISDRPLDRFGRMDALSRYGMASVEMLRLEESHEDRGRWGIVFATRYGSAATDALFIASMGAPGGASPLVFSYTLPSTLVGEVAMRHRITGTNLCVSAGSASIDAALWEAAGLVGGGRLEKCVAIAADAVDETVAGEPVGFAYAFLLEGAAGAEGRELARAAFAEKKPSPETPRGTCALLSALKESRTSCVVVDFPYGEALGKALIVEVK